MLTRTRVPPAATGVMRPVSLTVTTLSSIEVYFKSDTSAVFTGATSGSSCFVMPVSMVISDSGRVMSVTVASGNSNRR